MEKLLNSNPDKIYQAILKAAQTVHVLTDDLRQNLAQVTKKVVLISKRPRWNVRPSAWFSLWLNIVYWCRLHYHSRTLHFLSSTTWLERSGYGDHIAVHLHFEQLRKRVGWSNYISPFLNLFLSCLTVEGTNRRRWNIAAMRDNTGSSFLAKFSR